MTDLNYIYQRIQDEIALTKDVMERNDCGTRSMYWQFNDKLIRVGDHKPNEVNIETYNEGVNEVLLLMLGDVNENEIAAYCDNARILTDYLLINDEMAAYNEYMIKRFMGIS